MTSRLTRLLPVLIGTLFAASACSAAPPAEAPPPTTLETVWTVKASLVGEPEVVAGTIVSYLNKDGRLYAGAWDLTNGEQLWTAPATTSGEAPGVELWLDTVELSTGAFTAYVAVSKQTSWRQLVVADVRTGKRVSANELIVWPVTRPSSCPDDKAFCMQAYTTDQAGARNLRIDPLDPQLTDTSDEGLPAKARWLGTQLFGTSTRPPKGEEELGLLRDGQVAWKRSYPSIFGPLASSDNGWNWDEDGDILVGSGGPRSCSTSSRGGKKVKSCDRSNSRLVGLNKGTGETVWALDKAGPCSWEVPSSASTTERVITCRYKSWTTTYDIGKDGDRTLTSSTMEASLAAINRATGATLWEVEMGRDVHLTGGVQFASSEDQLILAPNGAATLIDLNTGAISQLDSAATLMCYRERKRLKLHWLDSKRKYSYVIGDDVEPCDYQGKPASAIPASWVPSVGIDAADGRWLLATPGKLTLVRLS